jgi:hypothetical protein
LFVRRLGVLVAALLAFPFFTLAGQGDGDDAAIDYFAHACADGLEHVAVYAPATQALVDITTSSTGRRVAWDAAKLEQLCPLPQISVYHCHTTHDVLTPFPSGSADRSPGDIGAAAAIEFACAKTNAPSGRQAPMLVHRLVTPRGEITEYGFSAPVLDSIRAKGRNFAHLLATDEPRAGLEDADAAAQASFRELNAEYFKRFVDFAAATCRSADIEHCGALTVERFAATFSEDDRMFVRTERGEGADAKPLASAPLSSPVAGIAQIARPQDGGVTELTPDSLGAFVASGGAMVSICAEDASDLRPCAEAKARIWRLAVACPRVLTAILDQDRYPQAKYLYPVAKDRTLLLFKKNPENGLNERFELTTMGEPAPSLISLLFCSSTMFAAPSLSTP